MEYLSSDFIHGDLWHCMTREDHGWIHLMREGGVPLANASFPSQDR